MNLLNEMENERLMQCEPFCIFIVCCSNMLNPRLGVTQKDLAVYDETQTGASNQSRSSHTTSTECGSSSW